MFKDKTSFFIFLAALAFAGFSQWRKYQKSVTAAVAAGQPEDSVKKKFGRTEILVLMIAAAWAFSLFGPLFVPTATWHDFGVGACAALSIWALIYAVKRYQSGAWRDTPKMTPLKAKFGVVCVPPVAFFLFWGGLVINSGVVAAEFFGTPGKETLTVTKHYSHDKGGNHYCLKADEFNAAYPFPIARGFCGLDEDTYDGLPDASFHAEFTLLQGPLGYVVQDFRQAP